jgi:proton glutamate symport protein
MIKNINKILLNHWTIILSMSCAIFFGIFFPETAKKFNIIGDIYLDFLQITVIPIMMTALICGFFNIFHSSDSLYYLKKLTIIFIAIMVGTTGLSVTLSLVFSPGSNLNNETIELLNNSIGKSESILKNLTIPTQQNGFIEFFQNTLPVNIVKSIYERKDLSILIFSIMLGIALGITKSPNVNVAISFFDAIFLAFMKIVNILLYALPFGIFFLISGFISNVGIDTLKSLFDLIALIYTITIIIFVTLLIIMAKIKKISIIQIIKKLKNPYLIAFSTSSSFAAMPAAMLALTNEFKIDKKNVELVMPLGVSIFKPGIMIRSITIAIFLMNLYQIPINLTSIVTLFFTSLATSLASTAGPAILSATMFGIVLSPLGIPPAIGIFLLLSIEPLVDPVTTMLNIQSNCAITFMVAKKD